MSRVNYLIPLVILPAVVWCLPSSLTTYTMFTNKVNWNAAKLICEATGGSLVKIQTQEKNQFLYDTLKTGIWDGTIQNYAGFYTGLHNAGQTDPGSYYWSDCQPKGTYDKWASFQPTREETKFCILFYIPILSGNKNWGTEECETSLPFVCEVNGGVCIYDEMIDTEGTAGTPFTVGVTTKELCLTYCDQSVQNNTECWGVTYYTSSAECILHLSSDSSVFAGSMGTTANSASNFYKKSCVNADVNPTVFDVSNLKTNLPLTDCDALSAQGYVFTIVDRNVTWYEASDTCSTAGRRVVGYRNFTDYTEALSLITPIVGNTASFWIGLSRAPDGQFVWENGTHVNWTRWGGGQPTVFNDTCVYASTDLYWYNTDCNFNYTLICKQPKGFCAYFKLGSTKGITGTDKGDIDHSACKTICNQDTTCIAYSQYSAYSYANSGQCLIHQNVDKYLYFNPANYEEVNKWTLYRYTCSYVLKLGSFNGSLTAEAGPTGLNLTGSALIESSSVSSAQNIEETTSIIMETTQNVVTTEVIVETTQNVAMTTQNAVTTDIFVETTQNIVMTTQNGVMTTQNGVMTTHNDVMTTQNAVITDFFVETTQNGVMTSQSDALTTQNSVTTDVFVEFTQNVVTTNIAMPTTSVINATLEFTEVTVSVSSAELSDYSVVLSTYPVTSIGQYVSEISPTPVTIDNTVETSSRVLTAFTDLFSDITDSFTLQPSSSSMFIFSTFSQIKESEAPAKTSTSQLHVVSMCPCGCFRSPATTEESLEEKVQDIVEKLTVEKKTLSKTINKLQSAKDSRPSAQSIGYVAIIMIVVSLVYLLAMDVIHVFMLKDKNK